MIYYFAYSRLKTGFIHKIHTINLTYFKVTWQQFVGSHTIKLIYFDLCSILFYHDYLFQFFVKCANFQHY